MFVEIAGYPFFTVDFGAGPRTFLAHSGWIGNYEDWLPTLAVLSKTWRAVSYDHRGAGETRVPVEAITAEALVDDIFRVMDTLGIERCVLGGFSAGTAFAARAAVRHPDRFDGLVLLNGSAGVAHPAAGPAPRIPPSRWPGADHQARLRWFIERCTPEPDVEPIRRWGEHLLQRATPEAAERLWNITPPADDALLGGLAALSLPTLLIHGERDPFASGEAMAYLSELLPHGRLVVLEGSGHVPAMIRPHDVAGAINDYFPE